MLYNFFVGHSASLLSQMIGRSLTELEPKSYELSLVEFSSDKGLYYKTDKEGNLFTIGFYITHYNDTYWKKSPSIHLDFCDNVINSRHKMRATNSNIVTYYSLDNKKEYKNQQLHICKKCISLLKNKNALRIVGKSFNEFILCLEENEDLKCKTPNKDGYSINWQQVSKAYREIKGYKCEECSFQLEDLAFSRFIQTHHIDSYNKLNNQRNNLRCLCVKCHSEVDEYHQTQFSSLENKLLLSEFEQYKSRL